MGSFHVECELYISAPEGDAVYSHGPTYARHDGQSIVETIRHEALHFMPDGNRQYYSRKVYRRRSDDNGRTWRVSENLVEGSPEQLAGVNRFPGGIVRFPDRDVLVAFEFSYELDPVQAMFASGNTRGRTYRTFCRLSRDGGATWSPARQVVDERPGYDADHSGPGLRHGRTSAVCDGQPVFTPDGAMIVGFSLMHPSHPPEDISERAKEHYSSVMYAQARPNGDATALAWRFGDEIRVPFPIACGGCCESATVKLTRGRIMATMRCQGDEGARVYSSRQTAISPDGGMTWGAIEPLRYDDGKPVWTPASVHQFFVSSKTGRTYVLGNFLDKPTYDQMPRYPLCIAEFDTERALVMRATKRIIQDLPAGAPVQRRYTNWGQYEERGSGDLIMLMPEQPKYMDFNAMRRSEDYTADCIRFRVTLGE